MKIIAIVLAGFLHMYRTIQTQKQRWQKYLLVFSFSFAIFSLGATKAFAAPPDSPYVPGETLNPSCSVGDPNCTVTQIYVSSTTQNYGISTTSPWSRLTVSATSSLSNISLFSIWAVPSAGATTTALTVLSNGNIGIGTSSPYAKLSIDQNSASTLGFYLAGYANSTADLFRISTSTLTATSTSLVINSNGKVGIGTTTPGSDLAVSGLFTTGYLNTYNTSATSTIAGGLTLSNGGLTLSTLGSSLCSGQANGGKLTTDLNGNVICAGDAGASGGGSSKFSTSTADTLSIYAAGASRTGFGTSSPLSVLTVSATSSLSNLSLFSIFAEASAGATTTALTVLSSGNVGIGTSTPWAQFSINPNLLGANPAFAIGSSTGGTSLMVTNGGRLGLGTTSPWAQFSIAPNSSTSPMFAIGSSTSASSTSFIVNGSGRVGIGTAFPSDSLEVVGDIVSKGTKWATTTSAYPTSSMYVTYGGGQFVAVSSQGAMTSPDGINWTSRPLPLSRAWDAVTYGNGMYVAVAGNSAVTDNIISSPDGINWTVRTAPTNVGLLSVTYGNGMFAAVGASATLFSSPDGINWTSRSAVYNHTWTSVTYGNGLFVAVAQIATVVPTARVITSSDGITWTARTTSNNFLTGVTYGNGLFVAVGETGVTGYIYTSSDGITWTSRTTPSTNPWQTVTYGNGLFVALSYSTPNISKMMTSPDGISWTPRTPPNQTTTWYGIVYGNGVFVATGDSGGVMYSGRAEVSTGDITQPRNIFLGSNVGIGTSSPWGQLSQTTIATSGPSFLIASSTVGTYFTVTSMGNVGIGTTTPAARLSVNQISTSSIPLYLAGFSNSIVDLFRISSSTLSATSTAFVIDSNGKVGIGTTTPGSDLAVSGLITTGYLNTYNTTATSTVAGGLTISNGGLTLSTLNSSLCSGQANGGKLTTDTNGNVICAADVSGGGGGANTSTFSTSTADTLSIYAAGVSRTGFGTTSPWGILSVSATSTSSNSNFPLFALSTSTASATSTAFIIDSNGKVGIGTSTPSQALSVAGNALFGTGVGSIFNLNAGTFNIFQQATTTILDNTNGSWSIATSGALTPIFSITTKTGLEATTTLNSGFVIDGGAFNYDYSSGVTSADNMVLGGATFDTDAGVVNWIDVPVSSTVTVGTVESYTAAVAGNSALTVSGIANGGSDVDSLAVGIGTSTPLHTLDILAGSTTAATNGKTTNFFGINVVNQATSSTASIIRAGVAVTSSGNWTGTGASNIGLYVYGGSGGTKNYDAIFNGGGNVGIGTTSPWARFSVSATSSVSTVPLFAISSSTQTATSTAFIIDSNGRLGLGTTSPTFALSVEGQVIMHGLTSNSSVQTVTLCQTPGGELIADTATCAVSSERFKHDIETLSISGLDEVMALRPVTFVYNDTGNKAFDGRGTQLGFIAEEAQQVDPNLVEIGADGLPRTFRYENFTAVLAKAVQELNVKVNNFISQGFASVKNLILDTLQATTGMFTRVETETASVSKGIEMKDAVTGSIYCITIQNGEFNKQLGLCVDNANTSGSFGTTATSTATTLSVDTEPPVITINGNNPATVEKGSAYVDLGATVTDNVDYNLGITVTGDQIDTSILGEHIVLYSATDQAGNIATSTRTVIVVDSTVSDSTTTPSI